MAEDLGKVALISGKLSGTKTMKTVLKEIQNPDAIESFLTQFYHLKLHLQVTNEAIYINDNQDFLEHLEEIENCEWMSLYANESFSRLYITCDSNKTYIIRINKVNSSIIGKFISKEKPIKFSLNSFHFIHWCVQEKIDMRNLYDIPTYIKILTNEVDPFKKINDYILEYTDQDLTEGDNEENSIIIGKFIDQLGKFLHDNAIQFGIEPIAKLINENNYFEAVMTDTSLETCTIQFGYANLKQAIDSIILEKEKEFQNKAYVLSPLGRIALKHGHNVKETLEELYAEDISITIFNELYNNNIPITIDEKGNYVALCKYKNLGNVFSLITATLNDIFYSMFQQSFEAVIHCDIKE